MGRAWALQTAQTGGEVPGPAPSRVGLERAARERADRFNVIAQALAQAIASTLRYPSGSPRPGKPPPPRHRARPSDRRGPTARCTGTPGASASSSATRGRLGTGRSFSTQTSDAAACGAGGRRSSARAARLPRRHRPRRRLQRARALDGSIRLGRSKRRSPRRSSPAGRVPIAVQRVPAVKAEEAAEVLDFAETFVGLDGPSQGDGRLP
jgi:hypothetical protein